MQCTDAYSELFNSFNDEWTGAQLDTAYNQLRASRQVTPRLITI
jgi:hypothetical protein